VSEWINDLGLSRWGFLLLLNLILLIAGALMDATSVILIFVPILFPIATELGIDPVHLGIIMTINLEIGMVTPPVGLNLFVTAGMAKMSIAEVTRAALPWLVVLFAVLAVVTYVPPVSLALPEWLGWGDVAARPEGPRDRGQTAN
jgi:C4-dicarboxylate transporter DctM subunit